MSQSHRNDVAARARSTPEPLWPPFVHAAVALALSAGFALGAALFAAHAARVAPGRWWPAAAQAHGHTQVFGWAGLMVLGVGLHFLPRLRGVSLSRPEVVRPACGALVVGLALRAVAEPAVAALAGGESDLLARAGLALSGLLELAGGGTVIALLLSTLIRRQPGRKQSDSLPVLGLFLLAFSAFGSALIVNTAAVLLAARDGGALVSARADAVTLVIGIDGFLIPIAVAMSVRTFPLYFQTQVARPRMLGWGLVLLIAGIGLRIAGKVSGAQPLSGGGEIAEALALVAFVVGLRVFARRRRLPRRPVRPMREPLQLHALSAFAWLLAAALLLGLDGARLIQQRGGTPLSDAERHAVGAGFITLLIFGVGAHLLPGFAGRPLRHAGLNWATLILGNLAASLRVVPAITALAGAGSGVEAAMSLAGVVGLLAITVFAWNVPLSPR